MSPDERSASDPASPEASAKPGDLTPAADIYETPAGLVIVAELPGVPRESLDIQVEKGLLRIAGTAAPPVVGDLRLLHSDFRAGTYVRRFTLSDELDGERISADFAGGVLTLTIPRAQRAAPRKIPVRKAD